jgi:D-tyrosyl-tRNA(Tyr) deacylase
LKLVIQRVSRAEVRVADKMVGAIGEGLLVLIGLERGDGEAQLDRAAHRVASLRVFEDEAGKMNQGLEEVGGVVLAVSQFTLAASIRRGRRPSFDRAMGAEAAQPLFERFVDKLRQRGVEVQTGVFGAYMEVELVNSGPVTLLWEDAPEARD